MVEINEFIDESEKMSLLPDRFYLILKPKGDGSFNVVAYDTTDPSKPVDSTFYVLKGLMETLEIDLDKLVQLGQMAIMDKMIELSQCYYECGYPSPDIISHIVTNGKTVHQSNGDNNSNNPEED